MIRIAIFGPFHLRENNDLRMLWLETLLWLSEFLENAKNQFGLIKTTARINPTSRNAVFWNKPLYLKLENSSNTQKMTKFAVKNEIDDRILTKFVNKVSLNCVM
ncbi:hypothetical protein [Thermococcus sp.]|uniref:hypothetical protein n=1 Tax=Thermococcus sp. TaxID=35749 RepID=UPI002617C15C|nr:hypothetical protein [Thermococcus sp.]